MIHFRREIVVEGDKLASHMHVLCLDWKHFHALQHVSM